jgi:hypothetical protein
VLIAIPYQCIKTIQDFKLMTEVHILKSSLINLTHPEILYTGNNLIN